jgi:hypothetical protein
LDFCVCRYRCLKLVWPFVKELDLRS